MDTIPTELTDLLQLPTCTQFPSLGTWCNSSMCPICLRSSLTSRPDQLLHVLCTSHVTFTILIRGLNADRVERLGANFLTQVYKPFSRSSDFDSSQDSYTSYVGRRHTGTQYTHPFIRITEQRSQNHDSSPKSSTSSSFSPFSFDQCKISD